jgi:hypothetical protein
MGLIAKVRDNLKFDSAHCQWLHSSIDRIDKNLFFLRTKSNKINSCMSRQIQSHDIAIEHAGWNYASIKKM